MNRLEEFLKELSKLTQKHGFSIGGCGCCGSPWIEDFEEEIYADNLYYYEKEKKYKASYDHPTEKGGDAE